MKMPRPTKRSKLRAFGTIVPVIIIACLIGGFSFFGQSAAQTPAPLSTIEPAGKPMLLGAASSFSQGWSKQNFDAAIALGVTHFRSGIRWQLIERRRGHFAFDRPHTKYPDQIGAQGGDLTLTINGGNPLYDDGNTPHSPEALTALGRFVGELLARYPAITTIEVGNEFNGANFVSGPVKQAGLAERGRYHLALLRSIATAARAERPDIRILGGATHSLPAGYLWPILQQGGAELMDGMAIHPYTTPVDQLAAQIAVLRRHPAARTMPLYVTEFGSEDANEAADHLMRGYAALASLGVEALFWYPLTERGDGFVPLIDRHGEPTSAGEAFRFIQSLLATRTGRNISPDPFTFVHAFDDDSLVVWGEARPITFNQEAIEAFDARGHALSGSTVMLSPQSPVILTGRQAIRIGEDVQFGCSPLVADSFYQFGYSPEEKAGGFQRSVRIAGFERGWDTFPGQQRGGVPWTPYLGIANRRNLRLTADSMLLAARSGDNLGIIHRYHSQRAANLRLEAEFEPGPNSADGVAITLETTAGQTTRVVGKELMLIDEMIQIAPGENLTVTVEPNGNMRGDNVRYRIRLHDLEKCASA